MGHNLGTTLVYRYPPLSTCKLCNTVTIIWVNFYFIDEAEVTQHASWGAIIGGLGLSIAPGEKTELTYEFTFSGIDETSKNPARIIQLFGHRHAATDRFAAWLNGDLICSERCVHETVVDGHGGRALRGVLEQYRYESPQSARRGRRATGAEHRRRLADRGEHCASSGRRGWTHHQRWRWQRRCRQ